MIAILLATYNGEKYLSEQLQSLLNQTNNDWKLYVRDDSSKDCTNEIIQDFQNKYPDKVSILNNGGTNLGAKESFIDLLKSTEAPYYMFCDQDDVWLPNKIEISLAELKRVEKNYSDKGILVFCDAIVVDDHLNILSNSFWKTTKTNPHLLKHGQRFQVFNCAPGCTMLFNQKLKNQLFPFPDKVSMHDWWVAIVAQRRGIVHPIDQGLILYRQHSSNEIGAQNIDRKYFLSKFNQLSTVFNTQKKHLEFLKESNGINVLQYYFIKISYTVRRFLSS